MSQLFEPLTLRDVTFGNRVWMSPMMQYCAPTGGPDVGTPTDWHLQHLASRAVGGAGLVMVEATAVTPDSRATAYDLGLWNERQQAALARVAALLTACGTVPGLQLNHPGRKAGSGRTWNDEHPPRPDLRRLAPSPIAFGPLPAPDELTADGIADVIGAFARAAGRAREAGFRVLELHGAHGYLIHSFLSPQANHRTDAYGGSRERRMRFALELVEAVRAQWPQELPLFFRTSATDWLAGDTEDPRPGWTVEDTAVLARELTARGVDLLDVSSGGTVPDAPIPVGPGYQVPLSARVRAATGTPTAAVGLITEPEQAEKIIAKGEADAVFLGRVLLRDPYWPRRAAGVLGAALAVPPQYTRAYSVR
ncbi:2,4-dienoyl-CoA reductase [Streptomyces sp. DvalAA-14]|uniref:NADH:flavin oxidoreductase/NADH oxidase n=1 Tax=unclassified Streptomyces TaxID=2593676 RepID=UPI00081B65CA|nr:NADH:flavin oxidoreductase/NADH oxidase [Streptomyces sp. DvalAA-14]MYS20788.1 NADH:flavin oxidoreductase/NADH oxidase [Streptomyces sp. SID4948]SCD77222.1 2,4-dienoyl-CoA reductase [Streptomyces sp. DvalAA-14]